jgi:hypothetical protein
MSSELTAVNNPANDIEILAAHRETLKTLAASDLPIAPNCQVALDFLNEHWNGGAAE